MTMQTLINNDHGQATRRLIDLFNSATDDELAYGLNWYETANRWANKLAKANGLSLSQVAGITAALSPQCQWKVNQAKTVQLLSTGDTHGFGKCRDKAKAILAGAEPLSVLKGAKERSFYDNIVDPLNSESVTIDRHAFDAVAGLVTDDRTRKQLERKGEYDRIAGIYRSAAHSIGVKPHVVQSVIWAVWRNRFGRFGNRDYWEARQLAFSV
jgi:hypothetical protein